MYVRCAEYSAFGYCVCISSPMALHEFLSLSSSNSWKSRLYRKSKATSAAEQQNRLPPASDGTGCTTRIRRTWSLPTHAHIHQGVYTFATSSGVTVTGVGRFIPEKALAFDWETLLRVPSEEVGPTKSKLLDFNAALVDPLSDLLCFRLDAKEKNRRGDSVIFIYGTGNRYRWLSYSIVS